MRINSSHSTSGALHYADLVLNCIVCALFNNTLSSMRFVLPLLFLLMQLPAFAQKNGGFVEGFWLNETGEYVIQIYQQDAFYNGRIVWIRDSLDMFSQPLRDVRNKSPQLRSRLVKGMEVMRSFEYDKGMWKRGKVYNYKNGNDYNAKLKRISEDRLRWVGYYGIFFFLGKKEVWTRVADAGRYGLN